MSRIRLTAGVKNIKTAERKTEIKRMLDGFEYNPIKAAVLKKILRSLNISLGYLITVLKEMSMLRGSEITPDGLLGGRGFIMPFKEIKTKINNAVSDLSDITDTLSDELNNPKWGLQEADKKKIKSINKKLKKEEEEIVEEKEEESEDKNKDLDMPPDLEDDDISPEDVKDSDDIKKLKELTKKDKVASIIRKNILANLIKGDENGYSE